MTRVPARALSLVTLLCGQVRLTQLLMLFLVRCTDAMVMPGLCPTEIKTVDDFDHDRFMGTWYEVQRTPFLMETMIRCNKFHYQDKGDSEEGIIVYMKGNRQSVSAMLSSTSDEDLFSLRSAPEEPILGFGLTRRRTKRSFVNYAALNETLRKTSSSRRRAKDRKLFKDNSVEKGRGSEIRRRRKDGEVKFREEDGQKEENKGLFESVRSVIDDGKASGTQKRKIFMTDEEWEEMIARRYDKIQEDKAKKRKAHKKRKNQQENKRKKDGFDHRHRHHHHHRYDADADKPAAQTISRPSVASLANVAKGVVQSVQKFGNDLSDATGQLFNNVNSMSPTLETWTKRGQEIADQIRGEGYTIEGELLTDAKGPHSLHMKTLALNKRSIGSNQ
ncbi:uncharacterized protein LOC111269398 isoform X2 [Varroa jacobsoni]|uniref:uncharacterized protein LOC111269398 isoform X2 n=1 Tax=Varroa jacobsoni TaxID=62625 RepID=UPI000BFA5B51|nr:uncharacterized protein LOC111269398 isoform X2 [Varroa jacobsoni]